MYGADALGAEGTLDNNFRLRKRRACATYGNRAAKWTATQSSETLYFNTMWTWHTDTGLPEGQYSKHIYLGETRVVTKQTSKLEASYGQSDEWHHQYYYHPDHLGSAQLVTDFEGNEYQRIEYTPYGELWVEKKSEKEEGLRYLPYKFTAKEQDEETGLYYYGARYLDAKYSRWMSADPAVGEYIPQAGGDNAKIPNGGMYNYTNLSLYHYSNNNPIKYTDPDGRVPFHFSPLSWSHHAPQRWFGYFDWYDIASKLFFDINGTRIEGKDFTVRMWKGNYGLAGAGGEIGLYSPKGRSLNRKDLKKLGIESSSFKLIDNKNGQTLLNNKEKKPSFWTTGFTPTKHRHKDDLTAEFSLNFKDEESAKNFFDQIKDEKENAEKYYWNGKGDVSISLNGKSVNFRYGTKQEE